MAIISILAGLLLPALQKALASARSTSCRSSLRQIGVGFTLYTDSTGDYLPRSTGNGQNWENHWWGVILAQIVGQSMDFNAHLDTRPAFFGIAVDLLECPEAEAKGFLRTTSIQYNNSGCFNEARHSYGYNDFYLGYIHWDYHLKISQVGRPSSTVMALDTRTRLLPDSCRGDLTRWGITENRAYNYDVARGNGWGGRYAPGDTHEDGPNILWVDGHTNWMHWLKICNSNEARDTYWRVD